MKRLIGIETEYGLHVDGHGPGDQVRDAMAFIRSYPGIACTKWDYRFESPRADARGFVAGALQFDPIDAQFDHGQPVDLPADEVRSDHILTNGARLYNDHGHPEYATPECYSLMDLIAHDMAGERIMLSCAKAYPEAVSVYKNNTDYQGASYGTHENYLGRRAVPFAQYAEGLLPFLATRIIYSGAGKVGTGRGETPFQISQRADVFVTSLGVDTLYRRPLMNTRDEPHADHDKWRRIHVIASDANMMSYATALKTGTMLLALDLIEDDWQPTQIPTDPVQAMQQISKDDSYRWLYSRRGGGTVGAVDTQREFLAEANKRYATRGPQTDWILAEWERTLDSLEQDPLRLADRLDWPAKLGVLRLYMDSEGLEWGTPGVVSVDLEYHNIDPESGLFAALPSRELVSEERVRRAMTDPPRDTRAAIRGLAVSKLGVALEYASWSSLGIRGDGELINAELRGYVGEPLEEMSEDLGAAATTDGFLAVLQRGLK